MTKTIKQIAEELGVSKTAVNKKIANLGLHSSLQKIGNQFAITNEQENLIKSAFNNTNTQTETETKSQTETQIFFEVCDLVSVLKNELNIKNEQIQILQQENIKITESLENITTSLKTAQALHVGTMQNQLETTSEMKKEYKKKKWWRFYL